MAGKAPDRHKIQACLRKAVKRHMAIGFGMSSPALECLIRTQAQELAKFLSPADKVVCAAGALPDWLGPAHLDRVCNHKEFPPGVQWPAAGLAGGKRKRSKFSAGFDLYIAAYGGEIKAKLQHQPVRRWHRNLQPHQIVKQIAGAQWKKLSQEDKQVFVSHAMNTAGSRVRMPTGEFRRDAPAEPPEPELTEDAEFTTPKKKKGPCRKLQRHFMREVSQIMSDTVSPEKKAVQKILRRITDKEKLPAPPRPLRR